MAALKNLPEGGSHDWQVSFVIPVRDDATRLARCLRSIRENEYPADRVEVIVVDNRSSDDSADVAASFGARVVMGEQQHVGELRNLGARWAQGQVLAFVDADHELAPGWIDAAVATLRDSNVGAAGDLCHAPDDGTWVQRAYDRLRGRGSGAQDVEWLGSGNLAIRRQLFELLGGFDRGLTTCEDVDLCRRLRAWGYRLVRDERLRSIHFGDPASVADLFRGELWRGRDNVKATLLGDVSLRALPSLIVPFLYLACLGTAAAGVISRQPLGLLAALLAAAVVLALASARTARMMSHGGWRAAVIGQVFAVALVYEAARALALVLHPHYHRPRAACPASRPVARLAAPPTGSSPHPAEPLKVLELRSVWGTGGGPDKTILLGASRSPARDVAVTACYIRDRRDRVFDIDARARAAGVDYVEVVERHSFDPSIFRALARLVAGRRIDIVHAHDYKTNLLALLLAARTGVVPLTTAHGWSGTTKRQRLYYFFDKRLIARFPAAIAVSDAIRQTLLRHGARPERVHVVRNGIDKRYFCRDVAARERIRAELSLPPGAIVVGSVGRLEPIKRFDVLLRAVAQVDLDPPPFLVVAGDGSCREQLSALSAAVGLQTRVRWLGHRPDARDVHQAFDVFVQSSDSEGLPNAVLEAMAVGTPVVATDVGGTAELIEAGVHGLLVPPGDARALARAVERTVRRPAESMRRAQAARSKVESELSFEKRMVAVEELYWRLAGGAGATEPRRGASDAEQWQDVEAQR